MDPVKEYDQVIYTENEVEHLATVLLTRPLDHHMGADGEPLIHIGYFQPVLGLDGNPRRLAGTQEQNLLVQFRFDVAHESHEFDEEDNEAGYKGIYPGGRYRLLGEDVADKLPAPDLGERPSQLPGKPGKPVGPGGPGGTPPDRPGGPASPPTGPSIPGGSENAGAPFKPQIPSGPGHPGGPGSDLPPGGPDVATHSGPVKPPSTKPSPKPPEKPSPKPPDRPGRPNIPGRPGAHPSNPIAETPKPPVPTQHGH